MLITYFRAPEPREDRGPMVLVIILEPENLERMAQGDPLDGKLRDWLPPGTDLRDVEVVIASGMDRKVLREFQETQDLTAFLNHLERGRQILAGDLHRPYRW